MAPKRRTPPEPAAPLDRERCICTLVRQAARRVSALYDSELSGIGLSITNYSLLRRIDAADGIGMTELANQMVMDRTTLSRNLQPLLRDELVEVIAGPDRRRRTLHATAAGRQILKRAFKDWQRAQARFKEQFGAERTAELLTLIDGALEAV